MTQSLKSKGINGIKWSLIDNIANSGITFLVGIVLARILSPQEFGVLGLIAILIAIANTIIDGGFTTALLRKENVTEKDYNTVFYSNLAIAILLYLVLFLSAKYIAIFFSVLILKSIIPVMGLLLIINSLSIIQRVVFIRKIDFKTQAKVSLIASCLSGIIGIGSALLSFGVWSLVLQQISRQLLNTLFLWIYSTWRPKLIFSKDSFVSLFGFGVKLLFTNLINTLYKNIFYFIIGKIYTVDKLGQYTRAEQFNTIFANNLTSVIQRVSFPMLSRIQNEQERITYLFRKIIIYSTLITSVFVGSLAATAKPLFLILIGEKWLEAAMYLQIMCFYAILYPLQNLNLNMLNIASRSDIVLTLEIIKKILFLPVFLVGFYYDIIAMLWAAVVYYLIEYFINTFYNERYFNYGIIKQLKDLLPIFAITLFVSFCMWSITLFNLSNIVTLFIQILIGIFLYFIIYELSRLPEYLELKEIVINQISSLSQYSFRKSKQ